MTQHPFPDIRYLSASEHETPGYADFPAFTLDVVSAELPCGVSWLASMLLECEYPVWNPWGADMSAAWLRRGVREYQYHYPGDPWSRTIPALTTGRLFNFHRAPVTRFSHALPGQWTPAAHAILFVRDPRDALFSAWRRASRMGLVNDTFASWLQHSDPHWCVPRPIAYLLFLATWRHFFLRLKRPLLIVRFEDTKLSAEHTFSAIRNHIGAGFAQTTSDQIERALSLSSFEHVQAIEREMLERKIFSSPVNTAGLPYEFRRHFDIETHQAVSCLAVRQTEISNGNSIYRLFGYDHPHANSTLQPCEIPIAPGWLLDYKEGLRRDLELAYLSAVQDFFSV